VLDTYANDHARRTNHTMAALHCYASWGFAAPAALAAARLALWALTAAVVLTAQGAREVSCPIQRAGGGEGHAWLAAFGAQAGCGWGVASLAAFLAAAAAAAAALAWMTGVVGELFLELDPELDRARVGTFRWPALWAAFCASNALLPLCMAYTFATAHIEWAGVRYTRRRGKVASVRHPS
jgi:hypothetical protein